MKKCWIFVILSLFFAGCSSAETFETVGDDVYLPAMAQMRQVELELPESASVQVMNGDQKLYLCEDYSLTVQTLRSGDLDKTLRSLCGYSQDALQVIQTRENDLKRADWVWISAGEGGSQVGRGLILDDGSYHYCLTAMTDAAEAGSMEEQWNRVFGSFSLS